MTDWLPIETSPKDGTEIIGLCWDVPWAESHLKGDIAKVWWQPEFNAFISSCLEIQWKDGRGQLHSPVTHDFITHWMPLPAPPGEQND